MRKAAAIQHEPSGCALDNATRGLRASDVLRIAGVMLGLAALLISWFVLQRPVADRAVPAGHSGVQGAGVVP